MEKTPRGTSVGVDDPYATVERCDHLTDDGRCRYAAEHGHHDPEFARERREEEFRCPAADPDGEWGWADCPHFRARQCSRECVRCGLEERRLAHDDERPLLEEHHLMYADDDARGGSDAGAAEREPEGDDGEPASEASSRDDGAETAHEITVYICRWCHAKIHNSWARLDDDASPDPEAVAAAEARRSKERSEFGFASAAERLDGEREN